MLFKSGLITEASGSLNGVTFSRNRYGNYIRSRAVPTNPNSELQSVVRSYFTTAAQNWRQLTAGVRQDWADYAAGTPVLNPLGDTVYLTGSAMHQRLQVFNQCAGQGLLTWAPTTPGSPAQPTLSSDKIGVLLQGASPDLPSLTTTVAWADSNFLEGANDILALWISPPVSAGVFYYGGPWNRLVTPSQGLVNGLAMADDPILATDPPSQLYSAGAHVFIAARQADSEGRLSPMSIMGPVEVTEPA